MAKTWASDVLALSPTAFYRLDETSGSSFADAVGGTAATIVGSPTLGGDPSGGTNVGGFSASGWSSTKYATTPTSLANSPTAGFTVLAAVKTTTASTQMAVARDVTTTGTVRQFQLYSNGSYAIASAWDGGGSNKAVTGSTYIRDGAWHLVALVWDGSFLRLYVNGAAEGTPSAMTSMRSVTGYSVYIGNEQRVSLPWGGSVDEVAIWGDTALTAGQISSLYTSWSSAEVTAVEGAGAVTAPAATASGTGVEGSPTAGSGAVVAPAATASGAGTVTVPGSGAVVAPAATASGAGTVGDGSAAGWLAEVAADAPGAVWMLDEPSGTTVADDSGNGHAGTYAGSPALGGASTIPGWPGTTVTLDGVDDTITVPDADVFDADDTKGFSYVGWWRLDDPTENDLQVIADHTQYTAANTQWIVYWDNRSSAGSPLRLRLQWGGVVSPQFVDWSGTAARDALDAGGMLAVTVTADSVGQIYWNGELVAQGRLTGFPNNAGNIANTLPVRIGWSTGTVGTFYTKGEAGPQAWFDRDLPQHRFRAYYDAATTGAPVQVVRTRPSTKISDSTSYDAYPGVTVCPNGDVVAVFRRGSEHSGATTAQGLYQMRSTDGGATWSSPAQIVSNADGYERATAALSTIGSTMYLVTWLRLTGVANPPINESVRLHTSTDNGVTWSAGSTITVPGFAQYALSESPLRYFGGYYYLAVWGQETSTSSDFSAAVIRSSDLSSWSTVVTFDTGGTSGYNETGLAVVDGTLVAVIRHEADWALYTATSTDGTTWSTPAVARTMSKGAPRPSEEGPGGRAYFIARLGSGTGSAYGEDGYLASVDATGAVREVEKLGDRVGFLYGQVAVVDGTQLVGVWSEHLSSTDADIYAATWEFDPPLVAAGAVVAPAATASGSGSVTITGAGAVTAPAATASGYDVAPPAEPVVLDVSVDLDVAAVESQTLVDSGDAQVDLDAGVALEVVMPLTPAAPPLGVLTEWPLTRQSLQMPALTAAAPTPGDYPVVTGEVGRLHYFVDGVDVTYLRGVPMTGDYTTAVPFCSVSASLEAPQQKAWDVPGVGDFAPFDMTRDPELDVVMVKPDDSLEYKWEGYLAKDRAAVGQGRVDHSYDAEGLFMQAAHELYDPPVIQNPIDPGWLIADILNSVTHRRWTKIPRFTTGLPKVKDRGQTGQSKWQRVQDILAECIDADLRQLTLVRVARRTYRLQWKQAVDTADWTVTYGAHGITVDTEVDQSSRYDAIYGRGVALDGGAWGNFYFPGLEFYKIPAYPMAGFVTMVAGTTDADTTTGRGVTDWQKRMRFIGYPVALDGVMNTTDLTWVRRIQKAAGILVDGVLGPQTWAATFNPGQYEQNLKRVRLPLASGEDTEPWLYSATGAILGPNPQDDRKKVRRSLEVDFGNKNKADAFPLAERMYDLLKDPGTTGTITLLTDPWEGSRFDIVPGDNVKIRGHRGDVVVQVAEVRVNDLEVSLTVDSIGRDILAVDAVLTRDRDARRDLTSRTSKRRDMLGLNKSEVVEYESESKAGFFPRTAINGNYGLWTVLPIFVSQIGVAKIEFEAKSPKAELIVALCGKPITANRLAALVPDPLASDDGWYDNVETLKEKYGVLEVFGTPDSPGGYWPHQKGDGPLTGELRDSASLLYESAYGGFVWVAVFTSVSTWVEGRVYPATSR